MFQTLLSLPPNSAPVMNYQGEKQVNFSGLEALSIAHLQGTCLFRGLDGIPELGPVQITGPV